MTFTARVSPPQMVQALALLAALLAALFGVATWSSLLLAVEGNAVVRELSRERLRLVRHSCRKGRGSPC